LQLTIPSLDNRLSKYNICPSLTFSAVIDSDFFIEEGGQGIKSAFACQEWPAKFSADALSANLLGWLIATNYG